MLAARVVVTILSALVLGVLAAPYGWYPLAFVAYVPMFWVLRPDTPRSNRWLGYLYGVVSVAAIFRWLVDTITIFSNIPWILAVGILLLFAAAFGTPYAIIWAAVHPLRRRFGSYWMVALPALLVVVEYISMYVLLFPYNQGVSQYKNPWTWQILSVTGIWGVSFLVLFVNTTLGESFYRRQESKPLPFAWMVSSLALLAIVTAWGAQRFERVELALRDADSIRVAQIQSAKGMEERMAGSSSAAFREWVDATAAIPPGSADLVVWPEGACPYDLGGGRARTSLSNLAKKGGFEMVIGAGTREREVDEEMGETHVRVFNSVYFFGEDGEVAGRYHKMVPLPFGEYLPFAETFPFLADLIEGPGNFRAGEEPVVVQTDHARIAAPICYEAILPSVCHRFPDPDLLVNGTNDAWFGDTAAPHQHAMLAAVRAVELGVPVFRSAYSGVSMVIEPHGHTYATTEPFTQVNRIVTVRLGKFGTLYRRHGDWFVGASFLLLLIGFGIAPWTRSKD